MDTPAICHAEGVIGYFVRQGTGIIGERQFCNAGWGQDILLDVGFVVRCATNISHKAAEDEKAEVGIFVALVGHIAEFHRGKRLGNGLRRGHGSEEAFRVRPCRPTGLVLEEILHSDIGYSGVVLSFAVDDGEKISFMMAVTVMDFEMDMMRKRLLGVTIRLEAWSANP